VWGERGEKFIPEGENPPCPPFDLREPGKRVLFRNEAFLSTNH